MEKNKSRGQKAYEGYCEFSGGKSLISGVPLPEWDKQAENVRAAWEAAAFAAMSDDPPPQAPSGPGGGPGNE